MILSVNNGSFGYTNAKKILNNISFSAQSGDLIAILGPNGAGKTTLLRCIMGFLKWSDGESLLDGKSIRHISPKKLWQSIAYVPQAKNSVSPYKTEEMILLGRGSHLNLFSHPTEKDINTVESIMNRLHISKLKGKSCNQLSGGELQMVLIAKALAAEPKILILDEPESNLDFKNQLIVLDTMSELINDGLTCIFNTHYPAHALQRANKALMLDGRGNCIFGDTPSIVTEKNIENSFGVRTVIGEVETHQNIMKDVIPLTLTKSEAHGLSKSYDSAEHLAVFSITFNSTASATIINNIFHEYHQYIVGRMGMPYAKYGVNIINLTLDGPISELETLTSRLNALCGVNVKAVYVRNETEEKENDLF